jgi:tetratricopeptide (TPR) repeat protein
MALSGRPEVRLDENDQKKVALASQEYLDSLISRPDDWASHYNMGNYFLSRGDFPSALVAFTAASKLEPKSALPFVNISIAYARLGENERAETSLRSALKIDPESAEANFNMALLKAEQKDLKEAERYFRLALKHNPQMAQAAYNLGVLLAKDRTREGTEWCRKAYELRPGEPRYGYTLVILKWQGGDAEGAIKTSSEVIQRSPGFGPIYLILGDIYEKQGRSKEAVAVYRQALERNAFSDPDRNRIESKLRALSGQEPAKTRRP